MGQLHTTAEHVDGIAKDNGFDPPTWENLPVKLMLVVTEMDEARDAVHGVGNDPLDEELADIAIRLLSILHSIWGNEWMDRVEGRKSRTARGHTTPYQTMETLMWPIMGHVCKAVEAWRHDNRRDTQQRVELALLETFRLADVLYIQLFEEIVNKSGKNEKRPHLHGKVQTEG